MKTEGILAISVTDGWIPPTPGFLELRGFLCGLGEKRFWREDVARVATRGKNFEHGSVRNLQAMLRKMGT